MEKVLSQPLQALTCFRFASIFTQNANIVMQQNNHFNFDIGDFKIYHQTVTAVVRN